MHKALRAAVVVGTLMGALAIAGPAQPVAAVDGGRIELTPPQITIWTSTKTTSLSVGTGVLQIAALDTSAGTMTVRPCAAAASPSDARVDLEPGRSASLRVVSAVEMCAHADHPVNVQVTRSGTVSAEPVPGRSQYVALAEPLMLFSGVVTADGNGEIDDPLGPRPLALPADATAAVVSVESFGSDAGYVAVTACGGGTFFGPALGEPGSLPAVVDLPAIGPGDTLCLRGGASFGGSLDLDVELLGYLAPSGPDATALPPMYTVRDEPTRHPAFAAFNPERALDTRNGIGCFVEGDFCYVAEKVAAGETVALDISEFPTPWTTALSLNVTVTGPETGGFLTVWPCDEPLPDASNLNFTAGETRANLVVAKFAADATVCMRSTASTHLIADVTGVYDWNYGVPATGITPSRILDTRNAIGVPGRTPVGARSVLTLQVAGRNTIPAGVEAVTMNVTAVDPLGDGFLTVWPCDQPMPDASNLNFPPGRTVPNLVTVALSATGTVCIYTYATTHLIADAAVWYGDAGSSGLVELSPNRILDTRNAIGAPRRKVEPNQVLTLQVRDRGGVRADAQAVVMNMTITNPEGGGFLTVWPCDRPMPNASNLNFRAGDSVPNLVTVTLSAAGTVCLSANARTDVLADVAAFLTDQWTTYPTIVLA